MKLTETQRGKLTHALAKLDDGIEVIRIAVTTYGFPHDYHELIALMQFQKSVLRNVLEGRDTGCELSELDPDFNALVSHQHLHNLAYAAALAREIVADDEREIYMETRTVALHGIKNVANFASLAYMLLNHMLVVAKEEGGDGE